jgi:hypothetical protein
MGHMPDWARNGQGFACRMASHRLGSGVPGAVGPLGWGPAASAIARPGLVVTAESGYEGVLRGPGEHSGTGSHARSPRTGPRVNPTALLADCMQQAGGTRLSPLASVDTV